MSALGIGAGCLAGAAYALLTIAVRTTASKRLPISTIVFIITGMGVLSLGSLSVCRLGADRLLDTSPAQLAWALAAGAFNLLAFLAITKGLQLTTVVRANVLNTSQIAIGAVAGTLWFGESWNAWLLLGVCLTIVGVVLIGQAQAEEPEVPGV
jgi:drug/metabolite transporter (DMT)-like permease